MKTIMVATDFSERSDRALRRATLLAKQSGAGLVLLHVVDDDQPGRIVDSECASATQLLHEQSATLRDIDGVTCVPQVIMAAPFAGIVQATRDGTPDLLVLGPHRRQVLRDVFVGTTAERTIRSVSCPALMANAPPAGPYRNVFLATDLSESSRSAIASFASLGIAGQARKAVVHVFEAPALGLAVNQSITKDDRERYLGKEREQAELALSRFMATCDLEPDARLLRHDATSPANEILTMAREAEAGLIVVGTRGRSGMARLLLGSVAEAVLRSATVDVLAVPPRR